MAKRETRFNTLVPLPNEKPTVPRRRVNKFLRHPVGQTPPRRRWAPVRFTGQTALRTDLPVAGTRILEDLLLGS